MTRIPVLLLLFSPLLAAQSPGFVSLMPKQDIREHWIAETAPAEIWSVKDGIIHCKGTPNGFLRTRKSYKNYIFRAEWRFAQGWQGAPKKWPNAGFFVHAGEVQDTWPRSLEVQGHFGEAGSLFGVRGGRATGAKRGPIVTRRPAFGEWDRYEITSRNGHVKVVLNGDLVNQGWNVYPAEGHICIQSEGWEVHYRNIEIQELSEEAFPPQEELERDLEEVARVAIHMVNGDELRVAADTLSRLTRLAPYAYDVNLWSAAQQGRVKMLIPGARGISQFWKAGEEDVEMITAMKRVFDARQRMTVKDKPGWTSVFAPVMNSKKEVTGMVEVVCHVQ